MALGIVRAGLCNVLTDEKYLNEVDRSRRAKDEVREFLQSLDDDEACLEQFDMFGSNLMNALERCISSCISTVTTFRSKSVEKEKIWGAFHQVWLAEVDNLWEGLFAGNGIPRLCRIIYQHVTGRLYADLIKNHFSYEGDISNIEAPPITTDEENIIWYAAGFAIQVITEIW